MFSSFNKDVHGPTLPLIILSLGLITVLVVLTGYRYLREGESSRQIGKRYIGKQHDGQLSASSSRTKP